MKTKNKEDAIGAWMNMTLKSWTWERLTEAERMAFEDVIPAHISGTFYQRYDTLNAIYRAFLVGIGYKPIGWRGE